MIKAIAKHDFVHNHLHPKRGEVVEGLSENTLKELEKNGLVNIWSEAQYKIAAAMFIPQVLVTEKKPRATQPSNKSQAKSAQLAAKVEGATLPNDTAGSVDDATGSTDKGAVDGHQDTSAGSAPDGETQNEQPSNTGEGSGTGSNEQSDQPGSTEQGT